MADPRLKRDDGLGRLHAEQERRKQENNERIVDSRDKSRFKTGKAKRAGNYKR